ncbi:hypothetical protein [Streptomyces nanshensis]|uniref:Uncharacterized protein n=1 Tax=Streptomyces nanshensis TaxID=518642 RepID=A0A1E7L2Z0_9ACTN|nr:hypothetical protein [Streptomyces nanshensis]OEV10549.1 hypothetical protein AN218_16965 [Streptomyces nanshensis]
MSGRGRRAALPPAGHRKAPVLDADGLVIRPVSGAGVPLGVWDFRDSPGPVDFRRALVAALAEQGQGWDSAATYGSNVGTLRLFFKDAAAAEPPITTTSQITAEWWKQWTGDLHIRRVLAAVVRRARGVPETTRSFMETPRRRPPARRGTRRKQAHTREELKAIRDAAAATVRAGRLRVAANTAVLERWRAGAIAPGDGEWAVGEVLDMLARSGDLPRYHSGNDRSVVAYVERVFGFEGNAASLTRLFPTVREVGAAAVLLIAYEAWNLSVLKVMDVPSWWPNADREDPAVHQVATDKARRGRRRHASNTLVDVGEGSSGRALHHVLELTGQARTTLGLIGRPTSKLLVGHRGLGGAENLRDYATSNVLSGAIRRWQRKAREAGVVLPDRVNAQALRHSAQAHHGRARNNTQDTHERDYQLLDEEVRNTSRGAVELGLAQAVRSARETVAMRMVDQVDGDAELVAKEAEVDIEVARRIVADRLRTPVASCADFLHSDHGVAGTPCSVSFLLCFACRNAVATGRDLPRIAYLHQALESLRSAVTPAVWAADWAAHHARIGDFLATYTTTDSRPRLVAAAAERDRELIHRMLERRLDP